jgi:hypothetical protein
MLSVVQTEDLSEEDQSSFDSDVSSIADGFSFQYMMDSVHFDRESFMDLNMHVHQETYDYFRDKHDVDPYELDLRLTDFSLKYMDLVLEFGWKCIRGWKMDYKGTAVMEFVDKDFKHREIQSRTGTTMVGRIKYSVKGTRMSGFPWTSLFNTLISVSLARFAKLISLGYQMDIDLLHLLNLNKMVDISTFVDDAFTLWHDSTLLSVAVQGDDLSVKAGKFATSLLSLSAYLGGFNPEIVTYSGLTKEHSFCSSYFFPVDGRKWMGLKPIRALYKIFVPRINHMDNEEHAKAISDCIRTTFGFVPWLGAAGRMVYEHSKTAQSLVLNEGKYNEGSVVGSGLKGLSPLYPAQDTFEYFARIYSIDVGIVLDVEYWIENSNTPFLTLSDGPGMSLGLIEHMFGIDV